MARKYSYIYSLLVEGEDDIVGMIAYSIYKMDKIDFIESYKTEHNNSEPSENDLSGFHKIVGATSQLESYRMKAQHLIDEIIGQSTDERIDEIKQKLLESSDRRLTEIVEKIKPSKTDQYLSGILQSVVASFVFASLTVFISYIVKITNSNVTQCSMAYILFGVLLIICVLLGIGLWYVHSKSIK
ncbi:MAG: hypothetical protein MJZ28_07540 [Paludibacteraceae bacterium]|nr:hypothetical protein [Paludibacteraceae bacterium]